MAARSGQKLKLIYIIDILKKYSDEEHPLSAPEICDKLMAEGVTAERKAVYDDIEQLISYGYDIIKTRVPKSGYFLASREFEIPEIYLLSDAVKTAKFITTKKTRELVSKLDGMLSIYQTKRHRGEIFIDISDKCSNEEIFYNIDTINRAIQNGHKVSFKYSSKRLKGREMVNETKERIISPYALTWQDDHYYLIGNYEKYDNLVHFRIDRMRAVNETDIISRHFGEVCEYKENFDVADYARKRFGMFSGTAEEIELRCSKDIIEQVTDRFGDKIFIKNVTEDSFEFCSPAAVSEAFVTWIMNYGSKIEVIKPETLKNMIVERAEKILSVYLK